MDQAMHYQEIRTTPLAKLSRAQVVFAIKHGPARDVPLWRTIAIALFGDDVAEAA